MLRRLFRSDSKKVMEGIMMNRLKWRLRIGILATLAMAILLTSPMMALAGKSSDGFIVKDELKGEERMLEPFAVIELRNGDEISFIAIPNERGRTEGVLVAEKGSADRGSSRSVEGLRDANPLEIFNAMAEPRTIVPKILFELYGDDSTLGPQGWARDLVMVSPNPADVYCPATEYFLDDMDYYADLFNDDDPFMSLYDGPGTKPNHWNWDGGNGLGGLQGYDLHGQANDTTAFYSQIFYCYEDWENAATFDGVYIGNYVKSSFRIAGHQNWTPSGSAQLTDAGDFYEHIYTPANPFAPGAAKYDFHMEIQDAKPADQFHIGATWVYGGPTDIKLGS